jgi:hypothetical protein
MSFLNRRVGLTYHTTTININQITAIPLSTSTGYGSALLNAGTIRTKGLKYNLTLLHLKLLISDGFKLNWTQNKSLVVELLTELKTCN